MNKILELKFGSHLYGTNTEESDMDFKAIYLPTAREIVMHSYDEVINIQRKKKPCERNTKDDVDVEVFSLDRFLDELMDGQTWAMDVLFAPESFYTEESTQQGIDLMRLIRANKDRLLTRNINAFVGYARKQAAKYGIKGTRMDALKRTLAVLEPLPNWDRLSQHVELIGRLVDECSALLSLEKSPLVEVVMIPGPDKVTMLPHLHVCGRKISFTSTVKHAKECYQPIFDEYGARAHKAHLDGGRDYKALSHAVRVNTEALEVLTSGKITFPRPDRELLLKVKTKPKTQQITDEEIEHLIENGLATLNEAHQKSPLREKPDKEWADDLVYGIYSRIVRTAVRKEIEETWKNNRKNS